MSLSNLSTEPRPALRGFFRLLSSTVVVLRLQIPEEHRLRTIRKAYHSDGSKRSVIALSSLVVRVSCGVCVVA